jgi:hypothetical protein
VAKLRNRRLPEAVHQAGVERGLTLVAG